MHSTDIMFTDPSPRSGQQSPESFTIYHNGDYSGDVKINLEGWRVDQIHNSWSDYARHGQAIFEVEIPFEVLAKLVADAVRQRTIEDLESADYAKVLGL